MTDISTGAAAQSRPKIKYKIPRLKVSEMRRLEFVRYCKRAANGARCRAAKAGISCDIDADFLVDLLVKQKFQCAVTGIPLHLPPKGLPRLRQAPFGPALDRIIPAKGYTRGRGPMSSADQRRKRGLTAPPREPRSFDEAFAELNLTPAERAALVWHLAMFRARKTVEALLPQIQTGGNLGADVLGFDPKDILRSESASAKPTEG